MNFVVDSYRTNSR